MSISSQINDKIGAFKDTLESHPECRADFRDKAALTGKTSHYAAFRVGRLPDIAHGEGKHAPPPPPMTPEERLLKQLEGASAPVEMLNPIAPFRGIGKGPGTLAASFGIFLNPELSFTPDGSRPIEDILAEGLPSPETSGIMPEMKEDIEAVKAYTPDWFKIPLPDMQGPFNIAHMVLGDGAFMAPLLEPDKWHPFMEIVTEFMIQAHRILSQWIGPERLYTHPKDYKRIAECSVNMVDTQFYLDYILPYDRKLVEYYGGEVAIHPCSGPHVFTETLENLDGIVYTEAGLMINKMSAGSISVEEALEKIGDRPIMLSVGEELAENAEEETVKRLFKLTANNPRVMFSGFTGLGWKKGDEPKMLDFHKKMNDIYAETRNV